MADGLLTIRGFADFKRVLSEYQKLEQAHNKQGAELDKLRRKSQQLDNSQQKAGDNAFNTTMRLVGAYASLNMAIGKVLQAMDKQQQLAAKATGEKVSIAAAQQQLAVNLGSNDSTVTRSVIGRVQRMAVAQGIDEAQAISEAAKLFSATEGAPDERRIKPVLEMMRAIAPLARTSPEMLSGFGGPSFDIAKSIPNTSPKDALALMLNLGSQSRITDMANFKNLVPAVAAGSQMFADLPEAKRRRALLETMAINAALTSIMGDDTGEVSRTTTANLNSVMQEVVGDRGKGLSPFELREAIANDDRLKRKFEKNVRGRSYTKEVQAALISGIVAGKSDDILEQIKNPFDQARFDFLSGGQGSTAEIKDMTRLAIANTTQRELLRGNMGRIGDAQALLFGGQFGDKEIPGFFEATRPIGVGGSTLRSVVDIPMTRTAMQIGLEGGKTPARAALDALLQFGTGKSFNERDQQAFDFTVNQLRKMQADTIAQELEKTRKATAEQTQATINAQNSAAAAAQLNAQTE